VRALPLTGLVFAAGTGPTTRFAAELLTGLGAAVAPHGIALPDPGRSTAAHWDASGLAELTGRPGGPPLLPVGAPATLAAACALLIELFTARWGRPVRVDGPQMLSARARVVDLHRGGTTSANGAARLFPAVDGWCALNLPRPDDLELVPALAADGSGDDPWIVAARWIATRTRDQVDERAELLGLAATGVRAPRGPMAPWRLRPAGRGRPPTRRLVVNLGSLWAAPLCAQLLHLAGYAVVDVESPDRPDGCRLGMPVFYSRLHGGHELAILDLSTSAGRDALRDLLRAAAVVVTGSRVTSLERLDATRAAIGATHDQVWVSITGHGHVSNRIAFGDDAAAAGGLVAWDATGPVFAGDAIADPLAGLTAVVATLAALHAGGSWDVGLALADVAAVAAAFRDSAT
jgi:hypothetical protein